ncbi:hypothetical protein SEPL_506 [Salmonella phage SE_PL]|nr:hypothetical protein 7t3_044 [Salmonella phage 7t3]QIG63119.1 hypothetical protein SEPL_506 [Salmonella phage SE_PL]
MKFSEKEIEFVRKLIKTIDSKPNYEVSRSGRRYSFWTRTGEQTNRKNCHNITLYSEDELWGANFDIFPKHIEIIVDYEEFSWQHTLYTSEFSTVSEEELFQQSIIQDFSMFDEYPDVLERLLKYSIEVRSNLEKANTILQ